MSDVDLQRSLGNVIRKRRQALGMSQEALAEVAKVHRTYVGSVERGERNISLSNLSGVAKALGCVASELLHDAEALLRPPSELVTDEQVGPPDRSS